MKAFWRPHKLNEGESILLDHLFDAHNHAVFRENVSSQIHGLRLQRRRLRTLRPCARSLAYTPHRLTYEILQAERYLRRRQWQHLFMDDGLG
jgi:hypothetical protein